MAELMLLAGMHSPDALRAAVQAGLTTVILDCEHGFPTGRPVLEALAAVESVGGRCLVRVAASQRDLLGGLADCGVHGAVLSGILSVDEVQESCAQLTPVPAGTRSVNPFTAAAAPANDVASLRDSAAKLAVWAMAETANFVRELATVRPDRMPPDLRRLWRGILIGPYDLASSQGEECSPDNARLVQQMIDASRNAGRLGLRTGLFARDPATLRQWIASGLAVDTVICGYDRDVWANACAARVSATAEIFGETPTPDGSTSALGGLS